MRWIALVGVVFVLALGESAQAAQWHVRHERVPAHESATIRTPPLSPHALLLTWVRVDGRHIRPVVWTYRFGVYRGKGFSIVERVQGRLVWSVANLSAHPLRITVGWRRP